MIKKYDIVATTGTYQQDGETKNRYKNVGAVMEKDGNIFILLDRIFNPAGLPNKDNRGAVLLSLYPSKNNSNQEQRPQTDAHSQARLDDEIPF